MDAFTATASGDIGTFAAGLLLAGAASGLIAGLLGAGGGVVIVPMVYQVLAGMGFDESIRMHVAVGTSLATIIPTSISSVYAHSRRGAVDWDVFKHWALPMLAGVLLGSLFANSVSGNTLSLVFVCVALPLAFFIVFRRDDTRLPAGVRTGLPATGIAGTIGAIATMMGIGGGGMGGMILTASGMPVHRAVGTGAAFGMVVSVPGALGMILGGLHSAGLPPYSLGYVNLAGLALVAPASFVCAPMGAYLAHLADQKRLRIIFAVFIAISALRMLYDVVF